ncbi:MAG: ketoacyl-ACP synthase III [Planctomycetota bacterium]
MEQASRVGVALAGLGTARPGLEVPGAELSNEALAALMRRACAAAAELGELVGPPSSAEFPSQRVGIECRRVLDASCSVRDLAVAAARAAVAHAGVDAADIAAVVVSTVTWDAVVPSVASSVHAALNLSPQTAAFDVGLGCNGFLAALDVAANALRAGRGRAVVVVGADAMSRVLDATERTTCTIFGDGAGAVVLQCTNGSDALSPIRSFTLSAFGPRIRIAPAGARPLRRFVARGGRVEVAEDTASRLRVEMDGRRVYREMVRLLPEVMTGFLHDHGLDLADVDRIAFHQANGKMLAAVARSLGVPDGAATVLSNIARLGNTTSASIPLLLEDAAASGALCPGHRVLLVGFGTGYSIGLALLDWPEFARPVHGANSDG